MKAKTLFMVKAIVCSMDANQVQRVKSGIGVQFVRKK
jgi:hypothetical protein